MPTPPPPTDRVAIVHDWLLGMRGGERVLESLLELFPSAEIHTLFHDPRNVSDAVNRRAIRASALNRLPGVRRYYRALLPLMPGAIARVRIAEGTRLVISTSHCVAHGVSVPPGTRHLVCCFSPMRYLYDGIGGYAAGGAGVSARALGVIAPRLRLWDRAAANRPGVVHIAISGFVAARMKNAWGVDARVIHPPVRTGFFTPAADRGPGDACESNGAYLVVSALTAYKRVDVAIDAAARLGRPLVIAGTGPLERELRRRAERAAGGGGGGRIRFLGRVSDEHLRRLYRGCRALIFPGVEDFGIVPLEAMACGRPVLALRAGGLLETHREGVTGAFFDEASPESLAAAWKKFNPDDYDPSAIRTHAEKFSEERFATEFRAAVSAMF